MNLIINPKEILSLNPCHSEDFYSEDNINHYMNYKSMTLKEFLDMNQSPQVTLFDRLWVILRRRYISPRDLFLLKLDFVRRIIKYWNFIFPNDNFLLESLNEFDSIILKKDIKNSWIIYEIVKEERILFESVSNKFKKIFEIKDFQKSENYEKITVMYKILIKMFRIRESSYDEDVLKCSRRCIDLIKLYNKDNYSYLVDEENKYQIFKIIKTIEDY